MSEEKHYDIEQSFRFLRLLDPDQEQFCFQLFKKLPGKDFQKPPIYGTLASFEESFALSQASRWNVTVTLAETFGSQRGLGDINRLRVAYLDFDSKLIDQDVKYRGGTVRVKPLDIEKMTSSKFPPHLIVESSPGNYHAYWMLATAPIGRTEAEIESAADSFRELQSNIAQYYGGDPGITAINQCVRLPGWWRFKDDDQAEPSFVHIAWIDENEIRYNPAALLDGYRKLNKNSPASKPAKEKKVAAEEPDANSAPSNENFGSDEGRKRAYDWLKDACEKLANMTEGGRDNYLNQISWTAGGYIAGGYLLEEPTKNLIREAAVACGLDDNRIRDKLNRSVEQGKHKPIVVESNVISMERPREVTNRLIETSFLWHMGRNRMKTCIFWRGDYWIYQDGQYKVKSIDEVHSFLRHWLNNCKRKIKAADDGYRTIDFQAKSGDWTELGKQLGRDCQLPDDSNINTWLQGSIDVIPTDYCVPFKNGLYDQREGTLNDLNPGFFNNSCLSMDYDENPGDPVEWMRFLEGIFTDHEGVLDDQAISLLQEWFGYVLTGSVRQQKMLLVIGPTRSGKGTIEKVLQAMVGFENLGAFDFSTLTTDFGMEQMWGKNLCICSDVRDMSRDLDKVVERVLKISANDPVPLNKKGKAIVNVKMNTKLMMFSNRVPVFNDAHGAMNARLLIVQMHQSFLGREDTFLADKLIEEVDKIAMWALQGLSRLLKNGKFTTPESSEEARAELRVNDSPLVSFINDRVELHPATSLNKDALWDEYQEWAHMNGYKYIKNKQTFFRDLIGLYGPIFKGAQAAANVMPRITYIRGAGLLSDPKRRTWTAQEPPPYDPKKAFDGRQDRYDERNPPPF